MIKRDGHYILTIDDWNTLAKHFMLNPQTISIKEAPDILFTEYQVYDIYSKRILFSFYNHDGKIRISGDGKNVILYEIDISDALAKDSDMIPEKIQEAIVKNVHNHRLIKPSKRSRKNSHSYNEEKGR